MDAQSASPASQAPGMDTTGMSAQDIEQALFGGPINQSAPDLSSLSDSSAMGGADYSFYTDPGGYIDQPTQQLADVTSAFFNSTTPSDFSALDPSYYDALTPQ